MKATPNEDDPKTEDDPNHKVEKCKSEFYPCSPSPTVL